MASSNCKYKAFDTVNWEKFFSMVSVIGGDLDDRKNRFDKSDILEQALEIFSDGSFTWVDKVGWDHEC